MSIELKTASGGSVTLSPEDRTSNDTFTLPSGGGVGVFSSYATSAVNLTAPVPTAQGIAVVEFTAATGTVTLPALSSVPVGGRVMVVKNNSTMGAVDINESGTDARQWGATQLRLYSDGDYWIAMSTGSKWLLIDGHETGSNANGEYVKSAEGTLICTIKNFSLTYQSSTVFSESVNFPFSFVSTDYVGSMTAELANSSILLQNLGAIRFISASASAATVQVVFSDGATSGMAFSVNIAIVGRWY